MHDSNVRIADILNTYYKFGHRQITSLKIPEFPGICLPVNAQKHINAFSCRYT